jgi:hypothetical protein
MLSLFYPWKPPEHSRHGSLTKQFEKELRAARRQAHMSAPVFFVQHQTAHEVYTSEIRQPGKKADMAKLRGVQNKSEHIVHIQKKKTQKEM